MTFAFSLFFPFLLVMVSIQSGAGQVFGNKTFRRGQTLIIGIISALIVLVPVGGLPLGRWLISINANFSIPLTAVLLSKVWEKATGTGLLDKTGLLCCWIFGMTAGLALYPMALGLGRFDPYELGWGFSWLFVAVMIITFLLLFMKNRFAVVLIVCVLCYDMQLLESHNLWDYLVDPFYTVISGAILIHVLAERVSKRD